MVGENGITERAVKAGKTHNIAGAKEKLELQVADYAGDFYQAKYITGSSEASGTVGDYVLGKFANNSDFEGDYTITKNGNKITITNKKDASQSATATIDDNGKVTWETLSNPDQDEPIDNSQSLVLGLVDDLGTRSTIYLYNNTDKITEGSITITMPDSSTETIVAQADTSNIEYSEEENRYATYTVSKNGTYTFSATANGETTETIVRINNIEKFTPIEDLGLSFVNSENKAYSYKGASVPAGYFVDTKSDVDTGLVVTDEIDSEGYSTGNEWVWVPVNSTVGNDDYYIEESGTMSFTNSVTYSKYSKLYSFVGKEREPYGTFKPSGTSTSTLGKPSGMYSSYMEPGVLENESFDQVNQRGTQNKFSSLELLAEQYVEDYENMTVSVDEYGGFYIGRYEITESGEKTGESITNKTWYELYNKCMTFGRENTDSGMIYGTLWDATMQWLAKSNYSVGYTEENTSGYGNYTTEAVTISKGSVTIIVKPVIDEDGMVLETGQVSYTKSNNIYDMSGNFCEWTQEVKDVHRRSFRGGQSYNYWGVNDSYTSYRDGYTAAVTVHGSTRPNLYIK